MPLEVSHLTRFVMDELQIAALLFMALVYATKIRWILSFKAGRERTPARGDHGRGIRYAYGTLALPWELIGTREHPFRYVEFAVFHIGVAVAIALTLIMPYWPGAVGSPGVVLTLQVVFALGALIAVSRLLRRMVNPAMRAISAPDDYFSLAMLAAWLGAGVLAAPQRSEPALLAFFGLTAFFLVYVPFSKISHYIYWPFIRYYMGKHFGHRGVYPPKAVPRHA
ncbi:MAG TPA: hypothetical protein VJU18_13520 [Vicinamibacteria bacterium]|nr:hypothetical protein [Vicinamibacteria bacterium]